MEVSDAQAHAFWWGIAADVILGASLTIIMLGIDRRRRNGTENAHKQIINDNAHKLYDIYAQVALDVGEIDTDEEGISERLSKYMDRNYSRIEYAINNIETHHAQRTKVSRLDKAALDKLIESSREILNIYCPMDIPESRRASLWKNQTKFHEQHKKMTEVASRFDSG